MKSTVSWPWEVQDFTDSICITLPATASQHRDSRQNYNRGFRNRRWGIRKAIAVTNSRIQRMFKGFGPVFQLSMEMHIHICMFWYAYVHVFIAYICKCVYAYKYQKLSAPWQGWVSARMQRTRPESNYWASREPAAEKHRVLWAHPAGRGNLGQLMRVSHIAGKDWVTSLFQQQSTSCFSICCCKFIYNWIGSSVREKMC